MADTVRTKGQLAAVFHDNDDGDISAQDGRDLIASAFGFEALEDPTSDWDSVDSAGVGAFFDVGSVVQNLARQITWFCYGGAPHQAIWWPAYNGGGGGGSSLTVQLTGGVPSINDVEVIQFDSADFALALVAAGVCKVSLPAMISSITAGAGLQLTGPPRTPTLGLVTPILPSYLPSIDTSKITGGPFDPSMIPELDTSKLGSGTLSLSRLPVIPKSQISSSGTWPITDLPPSGATPGTYGTSSAFPVLTIDSAGRITSATTQALPANEMLTASVWTQEGQVSTTSTTWADLGSPDQVTITLTTSQTVSILYTDEYGQSDTTHFVQNALFIDGSYAAPFVSNLKVADINPWYCGKLSAAVALSAGTHTIAVKHSVNGGTGYWTNRQLIVFYTVSVTGGSSLPASGVTPGSYGSGSEIPGFTVTDRGLMTFAAAYSIGNLPASSITTGTFSLSLIPSLPASQISSGQFSAAQIPNLDASKINSGSFSTSRIPLLPASQISSGQFSAAQIPNLDASKITSGTVSLSRLPASIVPTSADNLALAGTTQSTATLITATHSRFTSGVDGSAFGCRLPPGSAGAVFRILLDLGIGMNVSLYPASGESFFGQSVNVPWNLSGTFNYFYEVAWFGSKWAILFA